MSNSFVLRVVFKKQESENIVDFLATKTNLSKVRIKKVMNFGGVWLKPHKKKKLERIRKAKTLLGSGDYIEFHYDPALVLADLSDDEKKPICLKKNRHYSCWYKPSGLLTQGTKFGDGFSLFRFVEKELGKIYPIHRLDREVAGVVLIAHSKVSARALSALFKDRLVKKIYHALVLGIIDEEPGKILTISRKLGQLEATTKYQVIEKLTDQTKIEIELISGRFHQIRRHMNMIGHPVIGDPRYGRRNKNETGLKLVATSLSFIDPFTKKEVNLTLSKNLMQKNRF